MLLSRIDFCQRYIEFIGIVERAVSPGLFPAIRKMYETAPEDWISPDECFASVNEAIGFVLMEVLRTQKEIDSANIQR